MVVIAIAVGFGRSESAQVGGPSTLVVTPVWNTDNGVAVTIVRDPADDLDYYWRAQAYDQIDLHSMSRSSPRTTPRAPAANVFDGMADDVDPTGLHSFSFTVQPGTYTQATVLSPATPVQVDRGVRLTTVGHGGYFATIDRQDLGGGPYSVTALVAVGGEGAGMLNVAALRAAGTAYPPEVLALYTTVPPDMFGPNLSALRDQIVRTASSRAPIDLAGRLVQVLQAPPYIYHTDVRDIDCGTMSTPECFALSKQGYCLHYAMTMAVILRDLDIPARVVEGFLPGERTKGSPTEVIRNRTAHAWVEVYFPGFEWVAFDPTPGSLPGQGPLSIPSGPPTTGGSPRP